eukprot:Lithocolla_globosa_v1_NODE_499_length_3887_cov_7.353079.p2 type:complete len:173 gc:universal NODE_499_length_3887_cov_7.353079:2472-1954(-)
MVEITRKVRKIERGYNNFFNWALEDGQPKHSGKQANFRSGEIERVQQVCRNHGILVQQDSDTADVKIFLNSSPLPADRSQIKRAIEEGHEETRIGKLKEEAPTKATMPPQTEGVVTVYSCAHLRPITTKAGLILRSCEYRNTALIRADLLPVNVHTHRYYLEAAEAAEKKGV